MSGKIDKYEYLTGEKILPPDQNRTIELATFTYSPLDKTFQKETKTTEEQGKKQINAIINQSKRLAGLIKMMIVKIIIKKYLKN